MATGMHDTERQGDLWLATTDLARPPGHPFHERSNPLLAEARFDARTKELCRSFHTESTAEPVIIVIDVSHAAVG